MCEVGCTMRGRRISLVAALALIWGLILVGGSQTTALASSGSSDASWLARQKLHGPLYAVDATASDDVWAVGGKYKVDPVSHWNGKRWKTSDPLGATQLVDVDALPSGDVWALGTEGVLHRVDGRWSIALTMWDTTLWALSATSTDDVWVAGEQDQAGGFPAMVLHWDGTTWSEQDFPFRAGGSGDVDINARAPDDVWMINSNYPSINIEHWDGTTWQDVPSPDPQFIARSVIALSPTDAWIVGNLGGTGEALHWDGTQLSAVPFEPPQVNSQLGDVSATSATDVWAVGDLNPFEPQALIMHWDGESWSVFQSPFTGSHRTWLTGVTAIAADDAWAVGYHIVGKGPAFQIAAHWDGNNWTRVL